MTNIGLEYRNSHDMVQEAVSEALDHADMKISEIHAIVSSCMDMATNSERQKHSSTMLSTLFKKRIPIIKVPAGCAGGGQALWTSLKLKYDNTLVIGFERLMTNTTKIITDEILTGGQRIY